MELFWLGLAILLVVAGFLGTLIPVLPGIPVVYCGYLVWGFASGWEDYGVTTAVVLGVVTLLVLGVDYYASAAGAKKYGASTSGIVGAVVGALVGLIVLNLPGLIIGPFLGAVAGELLTGKSRQQAWRAGFGAFLGFLAGGAVKIGAAMVMLILFFYFIA